MTNFRRTTGGGTTPPAGSSLIKMATLSDLSIDTDAIHTVCERISRRVEGSGKQKWAHYMGQSLLSAFRNVGAAMTSIPHIMDQPVEGVALNAELLSIVSSIKLGALKEDLAIIQSFISHVTEQEDDKISRALFTLNTLHLITGKARAVADWDGYLERYVRSAVEYLEPFLDKGIKNFEDRKGDGGEAPTRDTPTPTIVKNNTITDL